LDMKIRAHREAKQSTKLQKRTSKSSKAELRSGQTSGTNGDVGLVCPAP
jgi:hypothetical protein